MIHFLQMISNLMYLLGLIIVSNSVAQTATSLDTYVSVILHDDMSLFYGDEPSLSSPPSTTGAIGINIEHEVNDSAVYYIEQQRYGADWIAAGIFENDSTKIDKGLDILNWVFDKIVALQQQQDGDDGSSVYRNSGDAVHSTSLFLEAATRAAALLLSHSGFHSDEISYWEPHMRNMGTFVAEHSAIGAHARDSNLEPFAHRYFLRAAGIQGVFVLWGEEAGQESLAAAASSLVEEGLSLQTEDGVFPERGGFDFNYQGIGLAYLGRYQQMIDSSDTSALSAACTASQSSFVDRVDSLGSVNTSDSTRINETARSGRPKRLDYKTIAQGFISCSLASSFNDGVYEELALLMARPIRPTVEYRFQGTADGQKSTGLDDDSHLFCRTADNAKNLSPLGELGSGLTSEANDLALKLMSTGNIMGSGQGTFCRSDGRVDSLDALQSFTLSGYYKVPLIMSNNIELLKTDRIKLTVVNNGKLEEIL